MKITRSEGDKHTFFIYPYGIIITLKLGFWFLKFGKIISVRCEYDKEFPGIEFHFIIPGIWFYIRKNFKDTEEKLNSLVEEASSSPTHSISELF